MEKCEYEAMAVEVWMVAFAYDFYVRREVYERYGLYDEGYRIAADTKFLLNILYKNRIHATYLPQFVVKMQMGGASTDMNRQKEMWNEDVRVFREIGFRYIQGA